MRALRLPGWAVAAACTLAACQERGAAPPAPAAATAASAAAPAAHRVTLAGPGLAVTLEAAAPPAADGVLRVRAIEIRREGESGPAQRIEGLDTQTPWAPESPGAQLIDMNFDGQLDLRLIEARAAGPNLPYLNWLYDAASGRWVASPALDAIASPRFDAATRELHADWRDGATRYGTDTWVFRDGQPVPVRREARDYQRPGIYTLQVSNWVDGAWRVVETREGRDP